MDTSEQYIKMCKGAVEIINGHRWEDGEFGYWRRNGSINIICQNRDNTTDEMGDGYEWLPRQDQLQEMVNRDIRSLLHSFEFWYKRETPIHRDVKLQIDLSMEQLWLAFVMKEKYNKTWNGEEWE